MPSSLSPPTPPQLPHPQEALLPAPPPPLSATPPVGSPFVRRHRPLTGDIKQTQKADRRPAAIVSIKPRRAGPPGGRGMGEAERGERGERGGRARPPGRLGRPVKHTRVMAQLRPRNAAPATAPTRQLPHNGRPSRRWGKTSRSPPA